MNNTLSIGFTGTRQNISIKTRLKLREVINTILFDPANNKYSIFNFNHGGCIGADQIFHDIIISNKLRFGSNLYLAVYPGHPNHNKLDLTNRGDLEGADYIHYPLPYLERNRIIVDKSDIIIAIPPKHKHGGTRYTINYAKRQNKPILEISLL